MAKTKPITINVPARSSKIIVWLSLGSYFAIHIWALIDSYQYSVADTYFESASIRMSMVTNNLFYLLFDLALFALFYVYFMKLPTGKRWLLTVVGFALLKIIATFYEFVWIKYVMQNSQFVDNTEKFLIGGIDSRLVLLRLSVIGITGTTLYLYRKSANNF